MSRSHAASYRGGINPQPVMANPFAAGPRILTADDRPADRGGGRG